MVPAAPAAKLAKGATLAADEVVLDLKDAVVPAAKENARAAVVTALGGGWAAESVAVRVDAMGRRGVAPTSPPWRRAAATR